MQYLNELINHQKKSTTIQKHNIDLREEDIFTRLVNAVLQCHQVNLSYHTSVNSKIAGCKTVQKN